MECREIQKMVVPYINDELDEDQLEVFYNHLKDCKDCQEELEIYFTVDIGLKQLEGEAESFNIQEALKESLMLAEQQIKNKYSVLITKYVVTTLTMISVIVIILLQLRIWIQNGLFQI